jgi:hypothetical protein
MLDFGWAKVAVFFAKHDPYSHGYREALDHAGLRYETITEISLREVSRYHVLVLCGAGRLSHTEVNSVAEWLKKGGTVICSGSTWGLETQLGLHTDSVHRSNAVMSPGKSDPVWPDGTEQIRFFGGQVATATHCEVLGKVGDFVGISRRKTTKATAIFLAPHVGQTLQLMQYGKAVECDSIGPSDGSAQLDNGILRAEDGTVLDYERDRHRVEGCDTPFFGYPHSDAVREMLIRAIVQSIDARGLSTPIFWQWPRGVRGTAMMTVDCQEFDREHVNTLHRMLAMFGAPATWMIALPGYSVDVYRAMKAWEHEVGLLYLTEQLGWSDEKFKMQWTALSRLSGQSGLNAARAYDGRWRGFKRFYEMCEIGGARASLSKGGRQPGTSGFLFGTSHPFVPARKDGSPSLVTEMPYSAYNPGLVTPDPVCEMLVYRTSSRYGCFHFSIPSNSIASPEAAGSLRRILSVCKQARLDFITPEQVHRYERGRRQLRVTQKLLEDEGTLVISSDVEMAGLAILINGSRLSAEYRGKEMIVETVERYGCRFNMVVVDVAPKHQIELRVWPNYHRQAA